MNEERALQIVGALATHGLAGAEDQDAAAGLNQVYRPTSLTAEQLVAKLGLATGRALLTALNTAAAADPAIAAAVSVLQAGGTLDVGSAVILEAATELVTAQALAPEQAESLAGLGRRYGTVAAADVASARVVGAARGTYEAALTAARETYDAAVAAELE